MATTAEFRNGLVLEIEGTLFQIVYFQHVKPGKGGAFVRTQLKNIRTGAVIDRTWNAGERVTDVRLSRRPIQFSYVDGHFYHFMDLENFETLRNRQSLIRLLSTGQNTPQFPSYMPPVGLGWNGKQYDALVAYVKATPALSGAQEGTQSGR